jgi:Tol biopolymer transport system component
MPIGRILVKQTSFWCLSLFLVAATARGVQVELISGVAPGGPSATAPSILDVLGELSGDGRYALFLSSAGNVVPGQTDTNNGFDLFLVDRTAGTKTLVSHSAASPTTAAERGTFAAALSADGRWIAYVSTAGDIVPGANGTEEKVYLYDRITGTTIVASHGAAACTVCAHLSFSDDGRFLAYWNNGRVVLYDRAGDTTTLVSHAAGAATTPANGNSDRARISGDGNSVAFLSEATDLVAGQNDANGGPDVFVWDRVGNTNTLVNHIPTSGASASFFANGMVDVEISTDGRWIAYPSDADDLIGSGLDSNGQQDVFLFDRTTGANTLVSHLASSTILAADGRSNHPLLSSDGRWVAYSSTATSLFSGQNDTNGVFDAFVYDRVHNITTLLSHQAGAPAIAGNAAGTAAAISADGNSIAVRSAATDLMTSITDDNELADVFVVDRPSGITELASRALSSPATTANSSSGNVVALSDSGRVTLFDSDASDLVAADNNADTDLFAAVRTFLAYNTLTPCRLFDSRRPEDGGSALGSGLTVTLHPPGLCGIPATARSLALNVTVTGATGSGHLVLFPGGSLIPDTSAINFAAGATRANNAVVALGGDGTLAVRPSVAGSGSVDVILDVSGYFE